LASQDGINKGMLKLESN